MDRLISRREEDMMFGEHLLPEQRLARTLQWLDEIEPGAEDHYLNGARASAYPEAVMEAVEIYNHLVSAMS